MLDEVAGTKKHSGEMLKTVSQAFTSRTQHGPSKAEYETATKFAKSSACAESCNNCLQTWGAKFAMPTPDSIRTNPFTNLASFSWGDVLPHAAHIFTVQPRSAVLGETQKSAGAGDVASKTTDCCKNVVAMLTG